MNIFLTLVFAVIAPGAGHAYMGYLRKAYVYGGLYLLLSILAPFVVSMGSKGGGVAQGASIFLIVTGAIGLISVVDACVSALKLRKTNHTDYRWDRGLICAVIVQGTFLLFKQIIIPYGLKRLP